jgi:hypothetical protein
MNHHSNADSVNFSATLGSISVYQRLSEGKAPSRVQILRATYVRIKGGDGRSYGRTENTVLLSLASGQPQLTATEEACLREAGLAENDLVAINGKLPGLARRARKVEFQLGLSQLNEYLVRISTVANGDAARQRAVREALSDTLRALTPDGSERGACPEPHAAVGMSEFTERDASASGSLERAASMILVAANAVQMMAAGLRSQGQQLTPGLVRSNMLEVPANSNGLDELKVTCNLVRVAMGTFEEALRDAKLVTTRTRRGGQRDDVQGVLG